MMHAFYSLAQTLLKYLKTHYKVFLKSKVNVSKSPKVEYKQNSLISVNG